jgi:putative two-component system response regulator
MNDFQESGGKKQTVLVVDDDRLFLVSAKADLSKDYSVALADSGEEALRKLEAGLRPDVILLDIDMRGMDGYETLEAIKAMPEARDTPVVFLTGLDAAEEQVKGLSSGVVDYITKPFEKRVLLARLKLRLAAETEKHRLSAARKPGTFVELDEEKFSDVTRLLDEREKEMARLIALGSSNRETANSLGYSLDTVKKITTRIYDKTGLTDRYELRKALVRDK